MSLGLTSAIDIELDKLGRISQFGRDLMNEMIPGLKGMMPGLKGTMMKGYPMKGGHYGYGRRSSRVLNDQKLDVYSYLENTISQ